MKCKLYNCINFILDGLLVFSVGILAAAVNISFNSVINNFPQLFMMMGLLAFINIGCFYFCGIYKRVWQYASINEAVDIVKGVSTGCLLFYVVNWLVFQKAFSLLTLFLIWIISLLGITGIRFTGRLYRKLMVKNKIGKKRVLIVGAGGGGTFVARAMKDNCMEYTPIGFIDDNPDKQGMWVYGLPVLGTRQDIPNLVKKYYVKEIIIAIPSAPSSVVREIVEISRGTGTLVKIIPSIHEIIEGNQDINHIREVLVEDLLHREPLHLDLQGIARYLTGKTVLVTGAGGSIGSELCRQIAQISPQRLILLGHGENSIYDISMELKEKYPKLLLEPEISDIQDKDKMERVFYKYRPQVVFHAAAHKHVPLMERHPGEAIKNNVIGTINVAEAASQAGSNIFVLISSDKAVKPSNILGATKRLAEIVIQWMNSQSETKFVAVRFGNVLGSRGSVVPLFKKQIALGGPVTVTHPDMVRYFMTIPEAVQLVIQAGAFAQGGEIFVLDMGLPVKILDLARDLISLSGQEPGKDIKIEITGSRPGEKLVEELLTEQEKLTAVRQNRLIITTSDIVEKEKVQQFMVRLQNRPIPDDYESILELIKMLIPAFSSSI